VRRAIYAAIVIGCVGCSSDPPSLDSRPVTSSVGRPDESAAEGFILRTGEGEVLQNGIVVKASPATGTLGSILVEQTFPTGGGTALHLHEQGDELFYVISGRGTATLGGTTDGIGPGDVIFVPRNAVHRIENLNSDEPLRVVFFMDSPELVEEFRARNPIDRLRTRSARPSRSALAAEERCDDSDAVAQRLVVAEGARLHGWGVGFGVSSMPRSNRLNHAR